MEKHITKCYNCKIEFERNSCSSLKYRKKKSIKNGFNATDYEFCSIKCWHKFRSTQKTVTANCGWCNKEVIRSLKDYKRSKSGFIFCDSTCSASYNNTKRRKSKRSKVEKMLFYLLDEKYPDLHLVANGKTMLDGLECDIEIDSLNLAIEWNGIVHYKPIYGEEKLQKIQLIDERKQNLAQEKGIRLIVVPDLVSNEKYVKEAFNYISLIINELMSSN